MEIVILSVTQYWNNYILEGLQNGRSPSFIRNTLKEAFVKEMVGLARMRMKLSDPNDIPDTPSNRATAANIARQTKQKWNALCKRCAKYKETKDICSPEDLVIKESDFGFAEKASA